MNNDSIEPTNPAFLNATEALGKALNNVSNSEFTQAESCMLYSMSAKVNRAILESVPSDLESDSNDKY